MPHELSPAVEGRTASVTARTRARRGLRLVAVALNLVLFATGLYFQAHPHDRRDLWTAGGVAAVALVNTAALTISRRAPQGARRVGRVRRIALLANMILLTVAAVIVVLAAFRDFHQAVLHGAMLLVPPLLTVVALRRLPHG